MLFGNCGCEGGRIESNISIRFSCFRDVKTINSFISISTLTFAMNLFNDHCLSGSLSLSLSLSNSLYASVPSKFAYSMHSTILSECHLDFKAINTISFSKFDLNKRETQKLGMAFKCGLKHECRKTRKPKKFTHQIFKWLKVLLTPSLKLRITAFRAGNQTKLSIDFFIK